MAYKLWTKKEINILHQLYPTTHIETISTMMGRPKGSIYTKACELGIKKSESYISERITEGLKKSLKVKKKKEVARNLNNKIKPINKNPWGELAGIRE